MVPAFDINKTTTYTLAEDTDAVKTIFHIGVMDGKTEAYLHSVFTSVEYRGTGEKDDEGMPKMDSIVKVDKDSRDIETVALCLKDIENFPSKPTFTEKTYPFGRRRVVSEETLNLIKPYIAELAEAIRAENRITAEAIKN